MNPSTKSSKAKLLKVPMTMALLLTLDAVSKAAEGAEDELSTVEYVVALLLVAEGLKLEVSWVSRHDMSEPVET